MADLDGRTILVTGASGGIGDATVRQLVAANAVVIASGRSDQALRALAEDTGCCTLAFDLSSEKAVQSSLEGRDVWGWSTAPGSAARSPRRWTAISPSSTR